MRFFAEIQRVDDEQRIVAGYAATEQRATDGLIVTREALSDALDGYMAWANIREMHQPSAAGIAREASVDDNGLYITAEIVDDAAWEKVKRGVYKGFSIGAKVTERDKDDRTIVRGIDLREISLVDRPSDPGAKIDLWHADGFDGDHADDDLDRRDYSTAQREKMAQAGSAMPDGSFPIADRTDLENAIRAFGRAKNKRAVRRHIMKRARALGATDLIPEEWKTMARAAQIQDEPELTEDDAVERADEALDAQAEPAVAGAAVGAESAVAISDASEAAEDPVARAVAAATAATAAADEAVQEVQRAIEGEPERRELPGAELRRGLYTVGRLNSLLTDLAYIVTDAQYEADFEGDDSPVPGKLRSALLELAKAYRAMSDEEVAELLNGVGVDVQIENGIIALAAASGDLQRADEPLITDEQSERLQRAFDAFVKRGWRPAQIEAMEETDELRRTVASLTESNDTLLRTVDGLTSKIGEVSAEVSRLAKMTSPAKTVGSLARAVGKAEDSSGQDVERAERVNLSDEDVRRVLDAMPDDERAMALMRASMSRPIAIR